MKRASLLLILVFSLMLAASPALAIPVLQLDILGGTYTDNQPYTNDPGVVSSGDIFTLRALLNPTKNIDFWDIEDDFIISVAILPSLEENDSLDLGPISIGDTTINVVSDMEYGVPNLDDETLQTHGVYETYFTEISFTFDTDQFVSAYNVDPDDNTQDENETILYYVDFAIDISGLSDGYAVHFDLYHFDDLIKAPFSHDAVSGGAPVPEPATMLLLGSGLLGIAFTGRRKFKK